MMTSQFRSGRGKTRKREISRDFSRFFDPAFFSEFHRSLLPFSMLCPDSDSRKGLFCVFPRGIGSVAGFGLAKAEALKTGSDTADNGRSLGIAYGEDSFRALTAEELAEETECEDQEQVGGMHL